MAWQRLLHFPLSDETHITILWCLLGQSCTPLKRQFYFINYLPMREPHNSLESLMLHYNSLAGSLLICNCNVPMSSHKAWDLMDTCESQYNIKCVSIIRISSESSSADRCYSSKYVNAFGWVIWRYESVGKLVLKHCFDKDFALNISL